MKKLARLTALTLALCYGGAFAIGGGLPDAKKTVLVVSFLLYPHNGTGYNLSIWKKDMKTEARCKKLLKRLKAQNSKAFASCEAKVKGEKL